MYGPSVFGLRIYSPPLEIEYVRHDTENGDDSVVVVQYTKIKRRRLIFASPSRIDPFSAPHFGDPGTHSISQF
jgi:hypothetical protein